MLLSHGHYWVVRLPTDITEDGVMKVTELYTNPLVQDWTAAAALSPCSPPGPFHTPQPHMTSPACWPLEHIVQ